MFELGQIQNYKNTGRAELELLGRFFRLYFLGHPAKR